jgi:hypothetical protein
LPIIADVVSTGPYTVVYKLVIPFSTFNIQLSEQQICLHGGARDPGGQLQGSPDRHGAVRIRELERSDRRRS